MQSLRTGLVSERQNRARCGLSGGGLPRRLIAFLLAAAAAAASAAAVGLIIAVVGEAGLVAAAAAAAGAAASPVGLLVAFSMTTLCKRTMTKRENNRALLSSKSLQVLCAQYIHADNHEVASLLFPTHPAGSLFPPRQRRGSRVVNAVTSINCVCVCVLG